MREPTFIVRKRKDWEVFEDGFSKPLASFSDIEDAKAYANDLADCFVKATVKVEESQ